MMVIRIPTEVDPGSPDHFWQTGWPRSPVHPAAFSWLDLSGFPAGQTAAQVALNIRGEGIEEPLWIRARIWYDHAGGSKTMESQRDVLEWDSIPLPMPKDKPAHEVRLGAIKAAIWKNDTEKGVRYNTTFTRLYRDEEEWKHTDSFGRDDLLVLAKVADQVHSWIHAQAQVQEEREDNGKRSAHK